jgi:alkylation response protein AidB-like acyl-CoA dehydrogenase
MALYAAMMAGAEDVRERDAALSAAKVQVCRSARAVGQAAVQLHGGVGMTMEYAIGHYFKRLTMIELEFGGLDFHLDRLSRLGRLPG